MRYGTAFAEIPGFQPKKNDTAPGMAKLERLVHNYSSVFFSGREFLDSAPFIKFQKAVMDKLNVTLSPIAGRDSVGERLFNIGKDTTFYYFTERSMMIAQSQMGNEFYEVLRQINTDGLYNSFIKPGPGLDIFHDGIEERMKEVQGAEIWGFGGGIFMYGARMTTGTRGSKKISDAYDACLSPFAWAIICRAKKKAITLVDSEAYREAGSQEQGEMLLDEILKPMTSAMILFQQLTSTVRVKLLVLSGKQDIFKKYVIETLGLEEYPNSITDLPYDEYDEKKQSFIEFVAKMETSFRSYERIKEKGYDGILHLNDIPEWAVKEALAELCLDLIRKEYLSNPSITNMSNFVLKAMPSDPAIPSVAAEYLKLLCEKLSGLMCTMLTEEYYDQIDDDESCFKEQQERRDQMLEADEQARAKAAAEAIEPDNAIDYEEVIGTYENKIKSLQRQIKEMSRTIAEKDTAVSGLESQLEDMQDQYKDLSDELDQANALITSQESSLEDDDISPETEALIHSIAGKRLLFVRRYDASGYKVMLDIRDRFPLAKFITSISSRSEAASYDAVIFMTRFIHHRDYWRSKAIAKALDGVTMVHCSSSTIKGVAQAIIDAEGQNEASAFVAGKHTA